MFWNKKQNNDYADLDSAMIELGREIERGLLLLTATVEQHWIVEENDYAKAVRSMMDVILKDKTLTDADRLEKAKQLLDWSRVYRTFIDKSTSTYGDFILARLSQFEEMLEPLLKTKPHDKVKEWISLSRDLCKACVGEVIAIDAHIDTDEFIPTMIIRQNGAPDREITEEEKNNFAHKVGIYGSKRQLAYEVKKKIEPVRSNIAEGMFGKLNDYMKGGSYSRLVNTMKK